MKTLDNPFYEVAVWLIPLIFAIVLHEISHGWVANMLGDPTAARLGRLSPNPIRHVDPVGTVALPMVLVLAGAPVFGWAKPVPVEARLLRNPRLDMVLVALAGPLMNLFLAVLTVIVMGLFYAGARETDVQGLSRFFADNLGNFLMINLFLAVFNLLPIPPFDGGHVVEGLLPRSMVPRYRELSRYGFPMLILLLLVLPMLSPRLDIVGMAISPIVRAIALFFLGSVGLA